MRALARPTAAGLLICAGLAPLPPDVLPTVVARSDSFATKSPDLKPHALPPEATSSAPERIESEIALAVPPVPVIERQALVVLTVTVVPPPPPFVIAPEPEPLPVHDELVVAPAIFAQSDRPAIADEASPSPIGPELPTVPVLAVVPTPIGEASPLPAVLVVAAAPPPLALVSPPPAPTAGPTDREPLRRIDIAQIGARSSGVRVPQLHEPGLVPGGPNLADKTAAMQVVLPPPAGPSEQELALLQMDTPSELTVRLGSEAVGKVAFRMSETRSIDVQLSGLLDVLADRFAPEDFARLRSAAAADSYVPLDSLRAIGLGLRYDPVYDELRVSA